MPKLRKQRRRHVYKYNLNRKRMRNKISALGNIGCKEIKNQWEAYKSVKTNLREMGLSYDPNVTIGAPKSKTASDLELIEKSKATNDSNRQVTNTIVLNKDKAVVAELLEADVKAPRESLFRLPKGQVQWITYLMDAYGDDYKAMVRDNKNYKQETWKQLRAKIKRFKSIPEQYNEYSKNRLPSS